jgi:hypothetical protein
MSLIRNVSGTESQWDLGGDIGGLFFGFCLFYSAEKNLLFLYAIGGYGFLGGGGGMKGGGVGLFSVRGQGGYPFFSQGGSEHLKLG